MEMMKERAGIEYTAAEQQIKAEICAPGWSLIVIKASRLPWIMRFATADS
jgi:hypothetical protein